MVAQSHNQERFRLHTCLRPPKRTTLFAVPSSPQFGPYDPISHTPMGGAYTDGKSVYVRMGGLSCRFPKQFIKTTSGASTLPPATGRSFSPPAQYPAGAI